MITNLQITFAPEILGSKCEDCGSVLERTSAGRWCDFCCDLKGDNVSIFDLLEELDKLSLEGSLLSNTQARDILNEALMEAYDDGYDSGRSECDECDDEW